MLVTERVGQHLCRGRIGERRSRSTPRQCDNELQRKAAPDMLELLLRGADDGTRTRNRWFTKPLLCQLSYVGGIQDRGPRSVD